MANAEPFGGPDPTADNAHKLGWELDEEEKELWMQLRRKRDFESRVADKRAQLQDLRDRRRKVASQHAEVAASVDHLTQEVAFALEQEKEVDADIRGLNESNRILQQAHLREIQHEHLIHHQSMDPSVILAEEKKREEMIQLQQDQINHHRAHLSKLKQEKTDFLRRQQFLFEKQRSAEQDRNRLLGTLQDDRSHINEVRQERIRLWEERSRMEREIAQILQEAQANGQLQDNSYDNGRGMQTGFNTNRLDAYPVGPGSNPFGGTAF